MTFMKKNKNNNIVDLRDYDIVILHKNGKTKVYENGNLHKYTTEIEFIHKAQEIPVLRIEKIPGGVDKNG